MGRRAVRAVNPALDLSRHFFSVDALPQPWDPARLFAQEQPLEVEVGSGKGLFLQNASLAHPDRNFMGIEVAHKYARFSAARLARRNLPNAIMVHGDAMRVFREILPDASLVGVHVYFPDPWWKARHRKRRVLTLPFLRDAARVLKPGGKFHFWTDVEEYFESTLELIREVPSLVGPLPVPEREPEHDLDYHTHFERRKRQAGLPIFRAEFDRNHSPANSTETSAG
jgi:tRNA (guanine-N7-)-methyltransferase